MTIDIFEIEIDGVTIYQPTAIAPAGVIVSREKQESEIAGSVQLMIDSDGDATFRLLSVKKKHRRKGLGRQLLKVATSIAIAHSANMIYGAARRDNKGATAFFEKLEFVRTEQDESNYLWSTRLPGARRPINGKEIG